MNQAPDYTLYLVTDRLRMSTDTLERAVEQAIIGGCTMIQLREKNCPFPEFYRLARSIKTVTDKYHVPLIINDRIDVALAVNAAGVHIGQSDTPAEAARKQLGQKRLLGVSVTCVEEAQNAVRAGADYLGVGALFPSRTKTDATPVSIDELLKIRQSVLLPLVAIGGISKENAAQLRPMGIDGIAVISAIIAQPDIAWAATELKNVFLHSPP